MAEPQSSRWNWSLMLLLALLYVFTLVRLPMTLRPISYSIDDSWQLALHLAHAKGMSFGEQIIFTYGPWGFAHHPVFHPDTFRLTVACRLALIVVLALGTWNLCRRTHAVIAMITPIAVWCLYPAVSEFLLIFIWLVNLVRVRCMSSLTGSHPEVDRRNSLSQIDRFDHTILALLNITIGWLSLVKFSYFMTIAGLLCGMLILAVRHRQLIVDVGLVLISVIGFWLLAGQSLWLLPSYVQSSLLITDAYAKGMGLTGEYLHETLFLAGSVALIIFFWRAMQGQQLTPSVPRSSRWIVALMLIMLCYMMDRAFFFRAEPVRSNEGLASIWLALWFLGATLFDQLSLTTRKVWGTILIILALLHPALCPMFRDTTHFGNRIAGLNPFFITGQLRLATLPHSGLRAIYRAHENAVSRHLKLPEHSGSADIFPNAIGLLAAQTSQYHPRPCIQSYQACSDQLNRLNAAFLQSNDAPENIFYQVDSIDDRLKGLDDSASQLELLARYQFVAAPRAYLWLRKRRAPRSYTLKPIQQVTTKMGETVTIPDGGLMVARVHMTPTRVGQLARPVGRSPRPTMTIDQDSGTFVPDAVQAGFFVSPDFRSTGGVLARLTGGKTRQAQQMRIDANQLYWNQQIQIEFLEVTFANK